MRDKPDSRFVGPLRLQLDEGDDREKHWLNSLPGAHVGYGKFVKSGMRAEQGTAVVEEPRRCKKNVKREDEQKRYYVGNRSYWCVALGKAMVEVFTERPRQWSR